MKRILVTGASGNAGAALVDDLVGAGMTVRAATRNPDGMAVREGVEPVMFSYDDAATYESALQGVDGVFLIAPPMDPGAPGKLGPIIEQATGHVVFLSAFGVDQFEEAPLRMVEKTLMGSGLPWTILRPNYFMENFSSGFLAQGIRDRKGIFLAAGDAKTSFIACRDIAKVARKAFVEKHHGKEYALTGPEALDHTEVARIIGDCLGTEITYHPLTEEAMLEGARGAGMPEFGVQYLAMLYGFVRDGMCAPVTDDVQRVTGEKAATFEAFARSAFQG
jgi:uncharacterized protein YbjT (DUF2867 family)